MAFIIGIAVLLPSDFSLLPKEVSVGFLFVLSILLIVGLFGTLLGEFVHGTADLFEKIVGWFLRRGWNLYRFIINLLPIDLDKKPDPSVLVIELEDSDDGHKDDGSIDEQEGWAVNWINQRRTKFRQWRGNQVIKIAYVIWPHREVFFRRFKVMLDDNFRSDEEIDDATFAEEYFMKEIAAKEFGVSDQSDIDQAYSVVVSILADSDFNRAFRFQARYSFCRSMWVVLFILVTVYTVTLVPQFGFVSGLYISQISPTARVILISIMLLLATIFAFASGSYKRNYINYLVAGIYAYKKERT